MDSYRLRPTTPTCRTWLASKKLTTACATQLARIVVGQDEVIDQLMIAIFARGHCILEGVPGLAKTLMVSTLADCLSLKFNRIQFTPDLMPSDITGTEVMARRPRDRRADSCATSPARCLPTSCWPTKSTARRRKRRPRCWKRCRSGRCPARRQAARPARSVLRAGHAKPDRAGRNVSAARGPARPLLVQGLRRLSDARGRERQIYRRTTGSVVDPRRTGAHRRRDSAAARAGPPGAGLGPHARLCHGPGPRHAQWRRRAGLHEQMDFVGGRAARRSGA